MKSTDFFNAQRRAQNQSAIWRIIFLLTAAALSVLVGYSAEKAFESMMNSADSSVPVWGEGLQLKLSILLLCVILLSALSQTIKNRKLGIHSILQNSGAKRIQTPTDDFCEKRLLNITHEMAIASGSKIPSIYVIPNEDPDRHRKTSHSSTG